MRTKIISTLLCFLFLLATGTAQAKDLVVKKPPESLDKLYPPQSKAPKWVQQMHSISGHFGATILDLKEKDFENADKHAEEFYKAYEEASKMVPEWKDYFDLKAAMTFAETVKGHNLDEVFKAMKPVGKTCGSCHADHYLAVWTRYHWPSVEEIKITDPIDEKEMGYGKYMHLLSSSFKGVTVNAGEGQMDRAKKALRHFEKRYMELKSTCSKCHTTDNVKLFFVGEEVTNGFSAMKAELDKPKPDMGNFWKNVGVVGKNGCKRCHLTHRAYAMIQEYWESEDGEHKH